MKKTSELSEEKPLSTPQRKRTIWGMIGKIIWSLFLLACIGATIVGGIVGGYVYTLYTELPSISRLEEFSPSLVTKVYDQNNEVIGEFFFEKRALVTFDDLPEDFVNALIAVEDKRFWDHFGIDVIGFSRAMLQNLKARRFAEGASTLTQQLTRGLFLSPEKAIPRKLKEWMLAIQIEQKYHNLVSAELTHAVSAQLRQENLPIEVLTKLSFLDTANFTTEQAALKAIREHLGEAAFQKHQPLILKHTAILNQSKRKAKERIVELYANQFYWGHGAYGVQAAAKLYFGKDVTELNLGECAMLAGLIQLPAVHSPLTHPDNAKKRQAHVLRRMIAEGYIADGRFRLTPQALLDLRAETIPEDVLKKLESLKDRIYANVVDMEKAIETTLGKEQADLYKITILVYAAEPTFKITAHALDRLKAQALPDAVYPKIASLTLNPHVPREEFVKTVETTLGKKEADLYTPVILPYAAHETAQKAIVQPFVKVSTPEHQIDKAPYFVEHVRQYLEEKYGSRVYQDGLQVYTTLNLHFQEVATNVLQKGLRTIQKRHGFKLYDRDKSPQQLTERLDYIRQVEWKNPPVKDTFLHAIVTEVKKDLITVKIKDYVGKIDAKHFDWAGKDATKLVKPDDILLVQVLSVDEANRTLTLDLEIEPSLEGAIIVVDPKTGHILAMVGGYDFARSKFNRAVQALRQPGSSFKPFVYLTALERGFTPSDIIVDEPTTFLVDARTNQTWTPSNYSEDHKGPMTLRQALENSTNVICAKIIQQVTPQAVVETARRLGITTYIHPYLSIALGSSEVYLLELVSAYSAFANRGYRVEPIFVTKVLDRDGNVLEENVPRARQVIAEDTNYLLVSLMRGVVERGTATAAKSLGRPLAGKTGTTNDNTDALFVGYSPSLVAGVWVGYDENRKSIGKKETGGYAALPIWIDFMQEALKNTPVEDFPVPAGISFVQIDYDNGLLYSPRCGGDAFTETFKKGTEPKEYCR